MVITFLEPFGMWVLFLKQKKKERILNETVLKNIEMFHADPF